MNKIEKAIKELEKIQARFEETDPVFPELQHVIDLLKEDEATTNTVPPGSGGGNPPGGGSGGGG